MAPAVMLVEPVLAELTATYATDLAAAQQNFFGARLRRMPYSDGLAIWIQ